MRASVTLVYIGFAKPQFETSLIVQKGLHVHRPFVIFMYVNLFIYLFSLLPYLIFFVFQHHCSSLQRSVVFLHSHISQGI